MTYTAYAPAAQASAYTRDAILSASPSRIVTMLYDRLLLDLRRAKVAQEGGQWAAASEQLTHAQAIVGELNGGLKDGVWDGSERLRGIYAYVSTALVNANIYRSSTNVTECIELIEPLAQAWAEAAASLPAITAPVGAGADLGVI